MHYCSLSSVVDAYKNLCLEQCVHVLPSLGKTESDS